MKKERIEEAKENMKKWESQRGNRLSFSSWWREKHQKWKQKPLKWMRENVKERERIGREWMLQSAGLISLLFLMFASTWLCNFP